ncbi:hypothetical protein [Tellurirhabdus rosea]|uniref:hypothetical protein n=1 Tax=Tellurirhabdus rosea TaxID=2674997 RepID=UPI002258D3C3|nr:hypothetical protein [Tellurirhabdus rosea]
MKKFAKYTALFLLGLVLIAAGYAYYNGRDRHPGYSLDLDIKAPASPQPLRAGFAALIITPPLPDRWTDADSNAAYEPGKGDTFYDGNNNGRFDTYWMAGFGKGRAANGAHDDLWARAAVIDDGQTRLAIVAVDLLGFSHKNVVNVRKALPTIAGITYTIVCSTHNHEGPDMIGMWGDSFLESGVNRDYERFVEDQVVRAIVQAASRLQPARLKFAQDPTGADSLVTDTRKPLVKDSGLYIMQALAADRDSTLGTLVVWGNHPETLWSKNRAITSDFPHYVREYLEKGISDSTRTVQPGLGGTVVYATGCIGGLMTTSPEVTVADPVSGQRFREPSFEKADAEGKQLARLVYQALQGQDSTTAQAGIRLLARTVELPLDNKLFRLGVALGIIDAGYSRWGQLRTEVAAVQLGEASFLFVPGEIYPEIVNGGIESPAGGDFPGKPVETPALRTLMRGRYKFVVGLANDELGYIIPKTEWDTEAPYLYGAEGKLYGEINSVGPETGPRLHGAMVDLLKGL